MVSKKKKKVFLITIISIVLIVAIAISTVFIVRKNKNTTPNTPVAENVNTTNLQTNIVSKAIADGNIPSNYNGTYIFKSIIASFDKNIDIKDKNEYLASQNVGDFNGLLDKIKQENLNNTKNNIERLVLYNGNINFSTGNPLSLVLDSLGTYVGDDDLSLVTNTKTKEQFYISLKYSTKEDALLSSNQTSFDGTKLYVFKQIYKKDNPRVLILNITYIYELDSV